MGRPQAEALCCTLRLCLAVCLPCPGPEALLHTLRTRLGQGEIMVFPEGGLRGGCGPPRVWSQGGGDLDPRPSTRSLRGQRLLEPPGPLHPPGAPWAGGSDNEHGLSVPIVSGRGHWPL